MRKSNGITWIKMTVDLIMSVLWVFLMGYEVTGNIVHEYIGIVLFMLVLLHCILNGNWFKSIGHRASTAKARLWKAIDILLMLDCIVLAVSSIMISQTVFSFLGVTQLSMWVGIHSMTARFGFLLILIHVGLHMKMILKRFTKMKKP